MILCFLETFCLKGAFLYLCMGKNCEWELEKSLHLCTILIVIFSIILNIYVNIYFFTIPLLENIYFCVSRIFKIRMHIRFRLKCIIITYFFYVISFKEKCVCVCVCIPYIIVTSWLGYRDIVENHYYNAQSFSCAFLYFHYSKKIMVLN